MTTAQHEPGKLNAAAGALIVSIHGVVPQSGEIFQVPDYL
jgi:hypothetical protein